jgi:prephenate dehydrogenase
MNVAVIGYGRFGRLLAHLVKAHGRVGVVDTRRSIRLERGVERISLPVAATRELIFLAVPVRSLRGVLSAIGPVVKRGSIVADVCAVKEEPMQWMRSMLPNSVSYLGTHPLFGPDSAGDPSGRSIILCPGRISPAALRRVRRFLSRLGMRSHLMAPSSHDRRIATAIFVTQLLGRSLKRLNLSLVAHGTPNARALERIIASSNRDSRELFEDLYRYNRHAREIPARLKRELARTRPSRR